MRLSAFAAAVAIATPALAQQPPTPPDTLRLPTQVVLQLRQYLGQQPHDAVAGLIGAIEGCSTIQIPRGGVMISHGECPVVSAAIRAEADRMTKAVADAKAAMEKGERQITPAPTPAPVPEAAPK